MTPITISSKPTAAQVKEIIAAGPGATVHHPLAGYVGRRRQVSTALARAGVPHRLIRSLAWVSRGRDAETQEAAMSSLVDRDLRARKISPDAVYALGKVSVDSALLVFEEIMPFAEVTVDDAGVVLAWESESGALLELTFAGPSS